MPKAIIYAAVNPDLVDGSSIWLMSIARVMSRIFDEVHVPLRRRPQTRKLLASLDGLDNVYTHEPRPGVDLDTNAAKGVIERLIEETGASAVLVRGFGLCYQFSKSDLISARLFAYITDIPFPTEKVTDSQKRILTQISSRSRRFFAQTEAARSYLEGICPGAAGKTLIMSPMIPDDAYTLQNVDRGPVTKDNPLKLVYSGKFASDWRTLEMLEIPEELGRIGIPAELHVIGDKFGGGGTSAEWGSQMHAALEEKNSTPAAGVIWHGGMTRQESMAAISAADVGIGWRTRNLDSSLEISTKALEYSAIGIPSLVNRSRDNEDFFGADYPLFVTSDSTAADAAEIIARSLRTTPTSMDQARASAKNYSMQEAEVRLRRYFDRAGALAKPAPKSRTKLLIVSHDFKFLGEIIDSLSADPTFDVKYDRLPDLHKQDLKASKKLLEWADVIFVEFAGPALVWYAENIAPRQRLVARLHGFELRRGKWLAKLKVNRVDKMIFVSDRYQEAGIAKLGLEPDNTDVVPNCVDSLDLDRPKANGAEFHLGIAGIVPFLKRPDRAVDLLARLVAEDTRYILHIRGRSPWEYPWYWNNPIERTGYVEFYNRIRIESLTENVVFEPFGADIGTWLRNIGVILSPSSEESFHLSPAEGMASGSVPIVWNRDGAAEIFGEENLVSDTSDAATKVLRLRDPSSFAGASDGAKRYAQRWDIETVMAKWRILLRQTV